MTLTTETAVLQPDEPEGNGSPLAPVTNDTIVNPEDVSMVAEFIRLFLYEQGRATKNAIRQACKDAGVPTSVYQKAMDRLDRQLNIITEVTNDDSTKAWTLKDMGRNHSVYDISQILDAARPESKAREVYGDWYVASGTMRLTSPALAPCPHPEEQSRRVFMRNGDNVLLISGYYDAMLKNACMKPEAPAIGSARFRVEFDQIEVPESLLGLTLRPVPPSRPGGSGQGVTSCESFAPGTIIPFSAIVPGSHVSPAEFEALMTAAGRFVGFSPAAAHKGFGRYRLESFTVSGTHASVSTDAAAAE